METCQKHNVTSMMSYPIGGIKPVATNVAIKNKKMRCSLKRSYLFCRAIANKHFIQKVALISKTRAHVIYN